MIFGLVTAVLLDAFSTELGKKDTYKEQKEELKKLKQVGLKEQI